MTRRSRAAYFAQLERPIAWCQSAGCKNRGARYSKRDKQQLCRECRATLRKMVNGASYTSVQGPMPNSTQLTAALKSLDLLSSDERHVAEVHLAMLATNPIQSTISTDDVPTLHTCLARFVEECAILVDLRLSILALDRIGRPVGAAAEHYESTRQSLIDMLQTAHLPHEGARRSVLKGVLKAPDIFASWSRSAASSWARTLKTVGERLRSAVDRSTSA